MRVEHIRSMQMVKESSEELLPGFSPDFPYIATCAELDRYAEPAVPWHWHPAVELFYMESGVLEYTTPNGRWVFPAGSGGFVNANVLHSSRALPSAEETVQLLHLFAPELLSGGAAERIGRKYIRPLTASAEIELIPLFPGDPRQAALLEKIRGAFELEESSWGFELALRGKLTEIWLGLLDLARPPMEPAPRNRDADEKMKAMLRYIHGHYPEAISVERLAVEAHISKRACFRLFRENLHMSPLEYMTGYRLRKAYQLLAESDEPVTQIAYSCGLGSSSYFGKLFRAHFHCSPTQFRRDWRDRDIKERK